MVRGGREEVRLRTLYWTSRFWPHVGGVEVLSLHLIPALKARGIDVQVVTSHAEIPLPDEERVADIPVRRLPFLSPLRRPDPAGVLAVRRALHDLKHSYRPDLVHIHFSGPESLFHWQTQAGHPAPTLVTVHAVPNDLLAQDSLLAHTLRRANWVCTVSAFMLDRLRRLLPEIEGRSSVIHNGLAAPAAPAGPPVADAPVFLCLGRLVEWKGFDVAVTAFASLLAGRPEARLIVAGDGPARPALERQVAALGITGSVEFRGWVAPDRVPHCVGESSAVVIPSRRDENLPVVALQAAQMARPVIASRVSGLPEIVVDQATGLLVEPDDPAALAAAMARLGRDPALAARLGAESQRRTAIHFSLERCAAAYVDLYRRLVAGTA